MCPDSSVGGLVWALQDMSQKYGDTVRGANAHRVARQAPTSPTLYVEVVMGSGIGSSWQSPRPNSLTTFVIIHSCRVSKQHNTVELWMQFRLRISFVTGRYVRRTPNLERNDRGWLLATRTATEHFVLCRRYAPRDCFQRKMPMCLSSVRASFPRHYGS